MRDNRIRPEVRRAIALQYDGSAAPRVIAKAAGAEADELLALARQHGVAECPNAPLAELLSQLALGDEIPEALYLTVAHIIAFAYTLHRLPADTATLGKHPLRLD